MQGTKSKINYASEKFLALTNLQNHMHKLLWFANPFAAVRSPQTIKILSLGTIIKAPDCFLWIFEIIGSEPR